MKNLECDCGFVAEADTKDEIVALMKEHIEAEHPGKMDTTSEKELVDTLASEI